MTYITDEAVEMVMRDLMSQQVAIIAGFHPRIRDRYMDDLRSRVRSSLEAAFSKVPAHD